MDLVYLCLRATLTPVCNLFFWAGNGGGIGNPYGAAASVGVLLVPILFVRIFSPPQYLAGVVLGCVSAVLPA